MNAQVTPTGTPESPNSAPAPAALTVTVQPHWRASVSSDEAAKMATWLKQDSAAGKRRPAWTGYPHG